MCHKKQEDEFRPPKDTTKQSGTFRNPQIAQIDIQTLINTSIASRSNRKKNPKKHRECVICWLCKGNDQAERVRS